MPKVSKEKQSKLVSEMISNMQDRGMSKERAMERMNEHMEDPVKLRILNALAASNLNK